MAQKKTDSKVEAMERDMEEVKTKLPGLEQSVEQLTQNMAKMMQAMEETRKAVSTFIHQKSDPSRKGEDGRSGCTTGESVPLNQFQSNHQAPGKWKESEGIGEASDGRTVRETNQYWEENNWRRVRKLEMPIFSGENPDGWLFRAERYFEVNGLTEKEKLATIGVSMEGDALSWLQWTEVRIPFTSWGQFRQQLLLRFRSTQEGSLCEKFLAVKQEETVADYRRMFEALAAPVPGIPEEVLESTFINGLRPEIRAEVRLLRPTGLAQLMETA